MKLVQILARELKEWPEGNTHAWQDYGKEVRFSDTIVADFRATEMCDDHVRNLHQPNPRNGVTRAHWEAEKARIAGKETWLRHRGRKCPVQSGTLVDLKLRGGVIHRSKFCDNHAWIHTGKPFDVMYYRLSEQDEQLAPVSEPVERKCEGRACEMPDSESHSKECLLDAAIDQGWAGPFEWRDRIRELDSMREELEATYQRQIGEIDGERGELVGRLASEGLAMVEVVQPVEDMDDWRNWKRGDWVVGVEYTKPLKVLRVEDAEYDGKLSVYFEGIGWTDGDKFTFYSRPAS